MAEEYKQPKSSKRVIELMDDGYEFGEAVKQAMKEEEEARKDLAGGGILNYTGNMMRSKYAMGSDDIPELEETSSDEYRDLLKSLNAPAENQASGIRSLDRAPSIKQEKPNMKVADAFLMEEYEKYAYDMIEQGREPMPLQQFIDQLLAEARMGLKDGTPPLMGNPAVVGPKMTGNKMREFMIMNPDVEDVADYKGYYKKLKAQDDEIKKMLDKAKKEKEKRAKGGIAGVL